MASSGSIATTTMPPNPAGATSATGAGATTGGARGLRTVNCYVPLTVKLAGAPSEDDWAALEEALVRQYSLALRRGLARLAREHPASLGDPMELADPARETPVGYLIPSYDDGQPTPVPTDTPAIATVDAAAAAGQPISAEKAIQLIRDHFTESGGLPAADGTHHGIYATLEGQSAPQVYYLNAAGKLESRAFTRDDGDKKTIVEILFDPGTYTAIVRAGEPEGAIYRSGRRVKRILNKENAQITIQFFVPAGPLEVVVRAPGYTFYPRLEVLHITQPNMTTGSESVYGANVTIWRRDKDDNWFPLHPLALIYAFIYYAWEVWKITPAPDGKGAETKTRVHEQSADAHASFFHYTWKHEGDYEIRCKVHLGTISYPDASPRPVADSVRDHIQKLEVVQAFALAQLERDDLAKTKPSDARAWFASRDELYKKWDEALAAEKNEARREAMRDAITKLKKQLEGQTYAGPYPIHAIFTNRRTSETRPIQLFLGPSFDPDDPDLIVWKLSDVTYPAFYATHQGTGKTHGEAIRAAFETSRNSFQTKYPPGQILANISFPEMALYDLKPWVFPIETESAQREAYEWISSAAQGLAMIALAVSFVFPPSAILTGAIVVSLAAGAAVSAVNIASRVNANSFEWDAQAICDVVNIAASFAFIGGTVAKGAAAGLSRSIAAGEEMTIQQTSKLASIVKFQRAMVFLGVTGDVTNGIILSVDTYRQLRDIDAQMSQGALADYQRIYGQDEGRRRWESERYARILSVLASAALGGLLIGMSLKGQHESLADLNAPGSLGRIPGDDPLATTPRTGGGDEAPTVRPPDETTTSPKVAADDPSGGPKKSASGDDKPPATPTDPPGGQPRRPTLLQRQRAAALRTEAARVEGLTASLRAEADQMERSAQALGTSRPDRAERLTRLAAQRRRVAAALDADTAQLRLEALDYETGRLSATADSPTAAEVDALFAGARAETGIISVPLAQTERNPGLLERLVRPLLRSRTGNRVVYRVEGGGGRTLIEIRPNGNVVLAPDSTIYLNFGSADRATEFLKKRGAGARIVAFEVDEAWVQSLRSAAIPEHQTGALQGQPRLVDVRFAEDQMEIPGRLVPELQQFAVPGSGRVLQVNP